MTDGNSYTKKQATRDHQHARDYNEWVSSASPEVRAELQRMGIDEPDICYHGSGMAGCDLADSPLASEETAIEDLVEPEAPSTSDVSGEVVWEALRRLIGEILTLPNRSLTVECLAVVSGLAYGGDSMTDIARRHCVTRAAVSKRCVELTEKLSLIPSRAMRSLTARKSYRAAQLRVRADYEK